jgi:ubiquinone/menaquinone biosynthesis C-methylase UbiE
MTSNEKEKYALAVGLSDLERMTMIGNIYMPYCTDFLFLNGLKGGQTIADIGCGPGNVSLWLAEQVDQTGHVVGIDNSEEQLAIVNQRISEKNLRNISTYKTDIYEVDQMDTRFDIVFCRFVLMHLAHPLKAIQKLKSILKPGGHLILVENDNSTWFSYPENDSLKQDSELLCKVGTAKKADFCIGPKLYGYLRQENFKVVDVKIAQPVLLDNNREYLILKNKAWTKAYLEQGLISQAALQNVATALHTLVNNQDYLLAGAKVYLVCGRK